MNIAQVPLSPRKVHRTAKEQENVHLSSKEKSLQRKVILTLPVGGSDDGEARKRADDYKTSQVNHDNQHHISQMGSRMCLNKSGASRPQKVTRDTLELCPAEKRGRGSL